MHPKLTLNVELLGPKNNTQGASRSSSAPNLVIIASIFVELPYRKTCKQIWQKLSRPWQIARPICANGMTWMIFWNMPLTHMCYHAEFGRFTSRGVGINRSIPKLYAAGAPPLRWGMSDPLQTRLFPCGLPCRTWQLLVKRYEHTYGGLSEKNWVRRVLPFNVIQGHRNWHWSFRYIYDFLITFHSNREPILYRFKDIAKY